MLTKAGFKCRSSNKKVYMLTTKAEIKRNYFISIPGIRAQIFLASVSTLACLIVVCTLQEFLDKS